MNNKMIKEIIEQKKEMKKAGYDLNNMFLVLNANKFKKNKFTFLGFSIIYSEEIKVPYCFVEYKSKKLSYSFVRGVESEVRKNDYKRKW